MHVYLTQCLYVILGPRVHLSALDSVVVVMMMSAYWATELSADQIMSRDLVRYLSTSHWDRHFRHTFLCFCFWFISYFWHHLLSASRGLHPYTVSSFHQLGGVPSLILVNCDLQIISHSLWMTDSEHDITYPFEIKWIKKKMNAHSCRSSRCCYQTFLCVFCLAFLQILSFRMTTNIMFCFCSLCQYKG